MSFQATSYRRYLFLFLLYFVSCGDKSLEETLSGVAKDKEDTTDQKDIFNNIPGKNKISTSNKKDITDLPQIMLAQIEANKHIKAFYNFAECNTSKSSKSSKSSDSNQKVEKSIAINLTQQSMCFINTVKEILARTFGCFDQLKSKDENSICSNNPPGAQGDIVMGEKIAIEDSSKGDNDGPTHIKWHTNNPNFHSCVELFFAKDIDTSSVAMCFRIDDLKKHYAKFKVDVRSKNLSDDNSAAQLLSGVDDRIVFSMEKAKNFFTVEVVQFIDESQISSNYFNRIKIKVNLMKDLVTAKGVVVREEMAVEDESNNVPLGKKRRTCFYLEYGCKKRLIGFGSWHGSKI